MTTVLETDRIKVTAECQGKHQIVISVEPAEGSVQKSVFYCADHGEGAAVKLEKLMSVAQSGGNGVQSFSMQMEEDELMVYERFEIAIVGTAMKLAYDAQVFDIATGVQISDSHCMTRCDRAPAVPMLSKLISVVRNCCRY
jgi:hypothetical protein